MSSSTEHVLSVVRRQILMGVRPPGEKITEVGISGELNVSRTPARTALAALEAEKYLAELDAAGAAQAAE